MNTNVRYRNAWRQLLVATLFLSAVQWPARADSVRLDEPRIVAESRPGAEVPFVLAEFPVAFSNPWALAFLPDGRALVTERGGRLLLVDGSSSVPVAGPPKVAAAGQGGLLDVALHPRFSENRLVYLSFAEPGAGGASTAVYRARLEERPGAVPALVEGRVIWRASKKTGAGVHFGSRLAFDAAGYLFVTTGERGDGKRARDPADGQGKVIRLRDDGSVPADNPFAGGSGDAPAVWSLGHRNAQGLAINPADGLPWLTEHGPKGGDEVNVVLRGADYGWDLTTYGVAYSGAKVGVGATAPGVTDPILHWTPSIAPSGLAFYSGDPFPAWRGNLLAGSLAGQKLVRLVLDGRRVVAEEVLLDGDIGRIRDVRVGPDGLVYLLSDGPAGRLWRLQPRP
ncbi:MAG: PQQ-dependent sugar dehydrogenase [Spirochaetales bacterium]|nr:PQQ-dependent sugar dehydrogenase [Spirochaetales bacterium]